MFPSFTLTHISIFFHKNIDKKKYISIFVRYPKILKKQRVTAKLTVDSGIILTTTMKMNLAKKNFFVIIHACLVGIKAFI